MITKIKVDGKDRIAIVFDEHFNLGCMYSLRRNLLSAIKVMQCSELIQGCREIPEIYDIVTLLEETELEENAFIKSIHDSHR